jgi:hypothetical protein
MLSKLTMTSELKKLTASRDPHKPNAIKAPTMA